MNDLSLLGRILIIFGAVIILLGILLVFGGKLPWFGKLPGDIYIQKKNFSFYFPITTSIVISVILSLAFMFFRKR